MEQKCHDAPGVLDDERIEQAEAPGSPGTGRSSSDAQEADADADAGRQAGRRGPEGLKAVERAAAILQVLARRPAGVSLVDLARDTSNSPSTVHRTLAVLRQHQLVRETPEGLHALGVTTVVLAGAFLEGLDLRNEARPVMRRLVTETGETCHLGTLASGLIVYIEKFDSPHPVRMVSRVGGTNPALTTAIGKAILAHSPAELVEETIAAAHRQLGMTVDPEVFAAELTQVRTLGYSTDIEGNEPGICCVGAPVLDHTGRPVAGISVSTPANRFDHDRLDELGRLVRDRTREISQALGSTGVRPWPAMPGTGEAP